jgi:hypothetical protein
LCRNELILLLSHWQLPYTSLVLFYLLTSLSHTDWQYVKLVWRHNSLHNSCKCSKLIDILPGLWFAHLAVCTIVVKKMNYCIDCKVFRL